MAEDKSDQSSSEESENEGESVAVDSVFNRGDINAPEESDLDSDEELQEALAAGLLKPGLNTVLTQKESSKPKTNNIEGLRQKLAELRQDQPWIERLDMGNKPAPLAPELAYQEDQHAKRREKLLKNTKHSVALADDPVHNDYKREMLFYRQAQATVIESLARLKNMGLPTKRPDDYFAQMMKSDDHMQKIRTKLAQKQEEEERVQKVRKLRELKKFGKQVQVEVQQKRHKEKREMMEQVKQFRKGKSDKIDFLDEIEATKGKKKFDPKQQSQHDKTKGKPDNFKKNFNDNNKRNFKDKRFGFGGKKKGSKANTKSSANDVSEYHKNGGGRKGGKKMGGKNKRVGKDRRKMNANKRK